MSRTCIIAIDFGTAFSGYAYSFSHNDQETQRMKLWEQRSGADAPKTPTCVLFDEKEEFLEFGFKARDKYFEMRSNTSNYYFFKDFKMELYRKEEHKVYKDLLIKDVNKKPMKALKVFSEALRFLKEDALKTINDETQNMANIILDFTWVLTVPAIWDIPARQFMREAAVQAGIVSTLNEEKLVIALEPEAASVRCKELPSEGFMIDDGEMVDIKLSPGTQYIVVDCGGGTIDITVHEVLKGGALKELHKASGNNKGGRKVDKKFIKCLREFFCDGLWEDYERDHPKEALQFIEDLIYFRQADRQYSRQLNFYKEFKDLVEQKKNKNEVLFKPMDGITFHWIKQQNAESYSAKLEISEQKMKTFFHETLVHICDSVSEILDDLKDIRYILLVGGLASSHILREHMKSEFDDRTRKVLCPKNPQEAIIKGAVMFGRDQSVIRSRKSAFTYGVATSKRFDRSKHKPEKKFTNKEGDWCCGLFSKLVEINEDVGWNETREYSFYPLARDQKQMTLKFYRTERKSANYVDDWGVEGPVGLCVVEMPDVKKGMNRRVRLDISFGSTEITAKATDLESTSTVSVKIDFITRNS